MDNGNVTTYAIEPYRTPASVPLFFFVFIVVLNMFPQFLQ